MRPKYRVDLRLLWPIAGLGGVLGLTLLVEVISIRASGVTRPPGYLLGFITSALAIVLLLYGSHRIATGELSSDRHGRITLWCLGGTFAFLLLNVGFMRSLPVETVFQYAGWVRWSISFGAGIGFLIGVLEARAIDREIKAERSRIRQEELQRERDRLDNFASVVSHDLRNPLNVAVGRVQLAREERDSDHLEAAERALQRMETLVGDLLTLARDKSEITALEPVELASLVRDCWANVDTARATLITETETAIQADETRLRQVFENLFRNAVEHGGEDVTITVGEMENGFYVEDDGSGIPETDREGVFDPGFTTNREGTGFGLSIVREIVNAHGWEVRVGEGTERGARFEITGVEFAAEQHSSATVS